MENLKLNSEVEITKEEAIEKVGNDYYFQNLLSGMSVETQEANCNFPVIQNVKFSIKKIKKAGTIVPDYEEWKCKKGQFVIIVTYDYRHPSNFCLNNNNLEKEFEFAE